MSDLAVRSFAVGLAVETGIALASAKVSPRWFFPDQLPKSKAKLWHTTAAAMFPAVVAPFLSASGLYELLRSRSGEDILLEPANRLLWRALGISVAHFSFDFMVMAVFCRDFVEAMRRPLYSQMMFHHLASALVWPYAFLQRKCVFPVAYYMISEISNIPLNARWFACELGVNGPRRMLFDASFFVLYTLSSPCGSTG
ncbi:hypothetical protein CTAYLR_004910 [Chrysophaeum taylorii]|uniref:TLC domain-containing protein n=1 Tax=Chrysophaeum taylorii TaxID=2483200 RepID=A0AAD7UPB0_9STRA|nr:hypothetical protein CTAYLR_004910 [Chrysophaeum taylorii]